MGTMRFQMLMMFKTNIQNIYREEENPTYILRVFLQHFNAVISSQ